MHVLKLVSQVMSTNMYMRERYKNWFQIMIGVVPSLREECHSFIAHDALFTPKILFYI